MQPEVNNNPSQPQEAPQPVMQPETAMTTAVPELDQTPQESIPMQEADPSQDQPTELPPIEPVQWQAAEYLQHGKQPIWYIGFAVVVIGLMAVAILMKSITFAILIPVMAAALLVYSHRPPRQLTYVVSEKGLYINEQLHPMGEFKTFGVMQDGALNSLSLIPVKRFRPSVVVYFPAEIGERLVDLLGAYLPMQEVHPDLFDRIVHKLHI